MSEYACDLEMAQNLNRLERKSINFYDFNYRSGVLAHEESASEAQNISYGCNYEIVIIPLPTCNFYIATRIHIVK